MPARCLLSAVDRVASLHPTLAGPCVQALKSAGIDDAGVIAAWQQCSEQIRSNAEIDAVERELAAAAGGADGRPASVLLNPTIRINDAQYRGDLAAVRPSSTDLGPALACCQLAPGTLGGLNWKQNALGSSAC